MPFNGAGIFSRTPGTRIANQGALVSAQVNDETDNLVNGINGKVNLDGLLTYTGLHTLFGDGTALLHQASVGQVQKGVVSHATAEAGTVDAIQVTMSPANTTLTTDEKLRWTSAGANTITAPTLSKDGGVTNKTIKKGANAALAVGDLGAAGQENEAVYNGTDWILTNPPTSAASIPTAASTTETLTGTDTAKFVTPDANAALWEKGGDIASAGTISIGEGGTFDVTGTTTITDIDPATDKAGRPFRLVHEGIHILTHNASTMICLTGANITTAVGDISIWQSEGSDVVRMVDYVRADGTALVASGITGTWTLIGTLNTTSGASQTQALGATYKQVKCVALGVSSGNSATLRIAITDDGATFGSNITITPVSGSAGGSLDALIDILNTGVAATTKRVIAFGSTSVPTFGTFSGSEASENGITHSIKFSPSSGSFDAGSIEVYGLV